MTTTAQMMTPYLVWGDTWRIRVNFADDTGPVALNSGGFIPMADIYQPSTGYQSRVSGKNVVFVDAATGVVDFVLTPPPFGGLNVAKGQAPVPAPIRVLYYLADQYGNRTTYLVQQYTPVDLTTVDLTTVTLAPVNSSQVKALTPQVLNNTSPTEPGQENNTGQYDDGIF